MVYTIAKGVVVMIYPYEDLGNRILALRKSKGLTREKLAEMADISVQFLADIEKGRKNMTVTTLRNIAAALAVTTDYIVNGKSNTDIDFDELSELYKVLDENNKQHALKLLRIFVEAVECNNNSL